MADQGTEFTTPVGRIVWGHPSKPRNKTDQQNKPVLNAQGQPIPQWAFGLAIPKDQFMAGVWPHMAAEAMKGYPSGQFPPSMSWKYKDGDGVDRQGKPYTDRPGYAGHIVLNISTELRAPNIFKLEGAGYRQMSPEEVKTGDYVAVGLNLKVNVPQNVTHTPGLYVNPLAIEFVGYGEEIQTGFNADPNAIFGGRQHALPPGASATPVGAAPGAVTMPGMGAAPAAPQPVAPPVAAPPPPAAVPQRPVDPTHIHQPGTAGEQWWINGAWVPAPVAPPPATDFIPGAPPQPGMPAMPTAAPGGGMPAMPPR